MKKTILSTLGAAALFCLCQGQAQAQMLLISEVYGGGGNAGSTYKNDFIELYNYGTTAIDMSAYAVYYVQAAAAGTAFTATASSQTLLSGILAPGNYYLIQEAAGTAGTTNLPTPNATGSIAISGTGGKVGLGLASTVPTFPVGNVNTGSTNLIDFLGWGGATSYEGTGSAAATTNPTSIARTSVLVDANNNATEFAVGAPTPVPEPSTYATLGLGVLGMFAVLRARRRTA